MSFQPRLWLKSIDKTSTNSICDCFQSSLLLLSIEDKIDIKVVD
jgi:hypothetical protein